MISQFSSFSHTFVKCLVRFIIFVLLLIHWETPCFFFYLIRFKKKIAALSKCDCRALLPTHFSSFLKYRKEHLFCWGVLGIRDNICKALAYRSFLYSLELLVWSLVTCILSTVNSQLLNPSNPIKDLYLQSGQLNQFFLQDLFY